MNQGRAWEATQGLMLLGCQQARKEADTQTEPPLSPCGAEGLVTGIVPPLPFQKNVSSSGTLNVKRFLGGGEVCTGVSNQLIPILHDAVGKDTKRYYFHLIHLLLGKCIKHTANSGNSGTCFDIKITQWVFLILNNNSFFHCLKHETDFLPPKPEYRTHQ